MKTKAAAAPVAARERAPQTLTLDMDLPPVPARRTRKATVREAPIASCQVAPLPDMGAKRVIKKTTAKTPAPAAVTPKVAAVTPKVAGKAKMAAPAPETVRAEREMALEGGRLWRMSGRHAVAYVQNASLACALLAVETRHLARHAMAVYYDKKGRAIAWQVRFDTQHWDDVMRQLG